MHRPGGRQVGRLSAGGAGGWQVVGKAALQCCRGREWGAQDKRGRTLVHRTQCQRPFCLYLHVGATDACRAAASIAPSNSCQLLPAWRLLMHGSSPLQASSPPIATHLQPIQPASRFLLPLLPLRLGTLQASPPTMCCPTALCCARSSRSMRAIRPPSLRTLQLLM